MLVLYQFSLIKLTNQFMHTPKHEEIKENLKMKDSYIPISFIIMKINLENSFAASMRVRNTVLVEDPTEGATADYGDGTSDSEWPM